MTVEYMIVSSIDSELELEKCIDEYLSDRWRLCGGVSVIAYPSASTQSTEIRFYQAMFRETA